MTSNEMIHSISVEQLSESLRDAGYRVNPAEQGGVVQLLCASQGIGFAMRFGNPAQEHGTYLDYSFNCALRIQGELPAGLAEVWNSTRRFARLSRQGDFLVLEMDCIVAAGVSTNHLRSQMELWDRLLQEFIVYLREYTQAMVREKSQAPVEAPEAVVEE